MTPKEVVEIWIERFNNADATGLAELYHLDATNHQVTQEPIRGRENIRAMFEQEFTNAEMVCIPEEIHRIAMSASRPIAEMERAAYLSSLLRQS